MTTAGPRRTGHGARASVESAASAAVEAFTPYRFLNRVGIAEPATLVRRVVAAPVRVSRAGLGLLRWTLHLPDVVGRLDAIVAGFEIVLVRIDILSSRAAATIDVVDGVRLDAASQVDAYDELRDRIGGLIDCCTPLIDAVGQVDPALVDAAAQLLQRLQPVLDRTDGVVVPLLEDLQDAIPDMRDILPVVKRLEPVLVDVETRIAGLPGSDRLRRRGERVIDEADDDA